MRPLPPITDPSGPQAVGWPWLNRWVTPLLVDARDLPFVYLSLQLLLVFPTLVVALFLLPPGSGLWWTVAGVHFALNNLYFKGPFGLMLHCTSHQPLFRPQLGWLNRVIPWVIAPLFGQTPETYFSHHIGMHHPENNLPGDKSCTMGFQRDSLRSFGAYVWRFLYAGVYDLAQYLRWRNRRKLLRNALSGEAVFLSLVVVLLFVQWQATVVAFVLPFFIFRVVAMLGNFTQHAFVNPDSPANPYHNSITTLNVRYNHRCWNDGYHTSHHLYPRLHWTEHPEALLRSLDDYGRNRAMVFDGLDYLKIFLALMNQRYDKLAAHLVQLPGGFASDAEAIAEMKRRTRKLDVSQYAPMRPSTRTRVVVSPAGIVS